MLRPDLKLDRFFKPAARFKTGQPELKTLAIRTCRFKIGRFTVDQFYTDRFLKVSKTS